MGRLGALAGLAPSLIFVAWISAGRFGTPGQSLLAMATISGAAIVAGWIVGSRLGSSIRSSLLGVVAYVVVAWLIYIPIGALGSTWQGIEDASLPDLGAAVVRVAGGLAYGLVSSSWVLILLLPFGAAWLMTFRLLRRLAPR